MRAYSKEIVKLARDKYLVGLSSIDISKELGVHSTSVTNWCEDIIRTNSEAQKVKGNKPPSRKGQTP